MMRITAGFLRIILMSAFALSLIGCRATGKIGKSGSGTIDSYTETIRQLSEVEKASELTARLSFNLSGNKASGQLRMRRDHSIQISISVLGLVEIVRIEMLPEKVIVMDRSSNRYAICHYADLPLRNELGLDFNVIQAILWNRVFSPGAADENDILRNIVFSTADEQNGSSAFVENTYHYRFNVNTDGNLVLTSNKVSGRGLSVHYSDFRSVSDGFVFPMMLYFDMADASSTVSVSMALSSVSVANSNWPDETGVGRRMTKVSLEELTERLSL